MAKIETFMNEKIINDRMTLELAVLFRCAEISEESFIHALVDLTDRKLKMDGAGNLSSIDGFYLGSSYCLDNFPDCGEFKASLTTHIIHCDGIPFCKVVMYGDYYHDKISERMDGFFEGLDYAGVKYIKEYKTMDEGVDIYDYYG